MSQQPGRERHRRQALVLSASVLSVTIGVVLLCIFFADRLNQIVILRFPLGFYLLAQGVLILMVAAAFWHAAVQDRFDASLTEIEED